MLATPPNPTANDVLVFVPAKDFEQSLRFYTQLGWTMKWKAGDNGLAELELASNRFLLQNFYARALAENFMLQVRVENAAAWYQHVSSILAAEKFGSARVNPPKEESYGAIVTHVWDPSGVLIHFTQFLNG